MPLLAVTAPDPLQVCAAQLAERTRQDILTAQAAAAQSVAAAKAEAARQTAAIIARCEAEVAATQAAAKELVATAETTSARRLREVDAQRTVDYNVLELYSQQLQRDRLTVDISDLSNMLSRLTATRVDERENGPARGGVRPCFLFPLLPLSVLVGLLLHLLSLGLLLLSLGSPPQLPVSP